jgi:hypothetical protein
MSQNSRPTLRDRELLGRENNANLLRLRHHFGDCYTLSCTFPRSWRAERIGEPQTVLTAESAAELREKMIADHERRPLPRRPSLSGDGDE